MGKKNQIVSIDEKKAQKLLQELKALDTRNESRLPTVVVVGKCSACKGNVVERTSWQIPPGVSPIIGPGSMNQMRRHIDIYCSECGIMYNFAPPKKRKAKKRSK